MKIYQLAPTPSAKRVTIFLNEIGLEIDTEHVDIRAGDNLSQEFLDKSINGRIPLLELDDGSYLCESVAICRYLESLVDTEKSLFGNTALEQANIEMWHRIVELQGLTPAFQAFRNISGVYADRENIIPSWGEESKLRLVNFLPLLDKQLSNNTYVTGSEFSIVDISAFVLMNVVKALEVEITADLANIQRWLDLIQQRPSFQA